MATLVATNAYMSYAYMRNTAMHLTGAHPLLQPNQGEKLMCAKCTSKSIVYILIII